MTQPPTFATRALRQLPPSLWWVLAGLVGASLSITLEKELFPSTPAATIVAWWVLWGSVMALVPLGVGWLWRVALVVHHPGWRLLWYVGAVGATGGLLLVLLLLGVLGVVLIIF